jgi:hypothetical protein
MKDIAGKVPPRGRRKRYGARSVGVPNRITGINGSIKGSESLIGR